MKKMTKFQKRKLEKEKWINRAFLFGGILFFIFATWFLYQHNLRSSIIRSRQIMKYQQKELPAEKLCMYSNKLQIKTASSFLIGSDEWYVCCSKCEKKLKLNLGNSQFAKDPLTHERIKKVDGFAVLSNGLSDKVIYFKSEENFKLFMNKK